MQSEPGREYIRQHFELKRKYSAGEITATEFVESDRVARMAARVGMNAEEIQQDDMIEELNRAGSDNCMAKKPG